MSSLPQLSWSQLTRWRSECHQRFGSILTFAEITDNVKIDLMVANQILNIQSRIEIGVLS